MSSPETSFCIPSFSFVATKHGKIGRYEHLCEYDLYIINHSDTTFESVWLANGFPEEEDDGEIGPIAPRSFHHLWKTEREYLNSPYIFDFYEKKGTKPYTYISAMIEEDFFRRNSTYIKLLDQEGWVLPLKRIIIDDSYYAQDEHRVNPPVITQHKNLLDMSDEERKAIGREMFRRIDEQRQKRNS